MRVICPADAQRRKATMVRCSSKETENSVGAIVREVRTSAATTGLLDHFVGGAEQCRRYVDAERLRGLRIARPTCIVLAPPLSFAPILRPVGTNFLGSRPPPVRTSLAIDRGRTSHGR